MAWNTFILITALLLSYVDIVLLVKRNKSARACFAELKCGGNI